MRTLYSTLSRMSSSTMMRTLSWGGRRVLPPRPQGPQPCVLLLNYIHQIIKYQYRLYQSWLYLLIRHKFDIMLTMIVTAYKTHKITEKDKSIFPILDIYLPKLKENSVVAIASNIIGICEGRMIKITPEVDKDELVKKEAEYYLPREFNQYGFMITINHNILVASGGIDESNGHGHYVLWPANPQKSVNKIREHLVKKHNLKHLGVIMTDSKLTPLRWGVTGVSIAHSGFRALNDYTGKPDIFGRILHAEKTNVPDGLASAAVIVMGEGNEQTPFAVIEDIPFAHFQKRNPAKKELLRLKIAIGDDVYSSLLTKVAWKNGKIKK